MYTSYYGLREKPFSLLPDPEYLYLSKQHRMALELLEYSLINQVGFCVITGDIGAGKTTLIRRLLNNVDERVSIGLLRNVGNDYSDMLRWILMAFGLKYSNKTKVELHQIFVDFIIEQYAQKRRTVLIVDEAQHMTADALEELRMLSNINADKDQVVQVILVGQKELRDTLRRPELAQFAQRIVVDYHLGPLSADDTREYIHHRIQVAGGRGGLFEDDACFDVHQFSEGIPRLINLLCDTAMVYGYAEDSRTITRKQVQDVVRERERGDLLPTFRWIAAAAGNRQEKLEHRLAPSPTQRIPHTPERRKNWTTDAGHTAQESADSVTDVDTATTAATSEIVTSELSQADAIDLTERPSDPIPSTTSSSDIDPETVDEPPIADQVHAELATTPAPDNDDVAVPAVRKTGQLADDAIFASAISSLTLQPMGGAESTAAPVKKTPEKTEPLRSRVLAQPSRPEKKRPILPIAIGVAILGLVGAAWLATNNDSPMPFNSAADNKQTSGSPASAQVKDTAQAAESAAAPTAVPTSDQQAEAARQAEAAQREQEEREAKRLAQQQAEQEKARRAAEAAALEKERQAQALAAQREAEAKAKQAAEAEAKRQAEALAAKRAAAEKLGQERRSKALAAKKAAEEKQKQERLARERAARQAIEEQARKDAALDRQRAAQRLAAEKAAEQEAQRVAEEAERAALARAQAAEAEAAQSAGDEATGAPEAISAQNDQAGFSANPCKGLTARYLSTCK